MRCLVFDEWLCRSLMTGDDLLVQVNLTYLSVQDLLLPVAQWLDDLEDRVKQSEVAESPRLIVKLLPLRLLGHAHKDVA